MGGPERESQKGSRETNTLSTGVLMEAPRSGREAPRGFPELDLRGRGGGRGHREWTEGRREGNFKLGLAEIGGSGGRFSLRQGEWRDPHQLEREGIGGLSPTRPREIGDFLGSR